MGQQDRQVEADEHPRHHLLWEATSLNLEDEGQGRDDLHGHKKETVRAKKHIAEHHVKFTTAGKVRAIVNNEANFPRLCLIAFLLLGCTSEVQRGRAIFHSTPTHAPRLSGNDLSCTHCHRNDGRQAGALPLQGVAPLFPMENARLGAPISLAERVRGCFLRSINSPGPVAVNDAEVVAVQRYLESLGQQSAAGRGKNKIKNRLSMDQLDPLRGQELFEQKQCLSCHVKHAGGDPGPPLWGPRSFNRGAGLARVYTLAGFIRHAMPLSNPGSLTDEEAQHLAAYIDAQERPPFDLSQDYPKGDIPVDAVYYPQLYPQNPMAERLRASESRPGDPQSRGGIRPEP